MIKKFSVKNFKNFKNNLVLDFSKVRDYAFNQDLIKNGLVNKMLIYGPNNCGKSNLGAAMMDITTHLTDNSGVDNLIYIYYINGDFSLDTVVFSYEFVLNNKDIMYTYSKDANRKLVTEELWENGNLLFKYDYQTNKYVNNLEEAQTIDIQKRNKDMSVLKYIYTNTLYFSDDSAVKLLMDFVNNMLWFRSLRSNEFIGVMDNGGNFTAFYHADSIASSLGITRY